MAQSHDKTSLDRGTSIASDDVRKRAARLLATTVFFGLLTLIVLVAIPYGTVQPWWQALFECAVFVLAALWFLEGFLSNVWDLSTYHILWPLLALAAFAFLQTLPIGEVNNVSLGIGRGVWKTLSADPHGTRRWVSKMLALILVGAMLLRYTSNERRLRALIYVVVGVALASASFGLVRQVVQHEVGFILPHLKPGYGYAQFINKNHFPFLMEMAIGLVLGLSMSGVVKRDRLLIHIGVALLLAGALVSSNSRGGIFSLVCQLILTASLFFMVRRVRTSVDSSRTALRWVLRAGSSLVVRALLIGCLIVAIGVGVVWIGGDPLVGNFQAMPTEVGAPMEGVRWGVRRWDIWPATWRLIKDHPVAGVGYGGYWMAIPEYHDASGEKTPQEAHNDYLELLASGGLIGIALGGWFVCAFVRSVLPRLRSSGRFRRAATFGALIGLSGIAIHSVVDFGLHIMINALIFMALVVIATADISSQRA